MKSCGLILLLFHSWLCFPLTFGFRIEEGEEGILVTGGITRDSCTYLVSFLLLKNLLAGVRRHKVPLLGYHVSTLALVEPCSHLLLELSADARRTRNVHAHLLDKSKNEHIVLVTQPLQGRLCQALLHIPALLTLFVQPTGQRIFHPLDIIVVEYKVHVRILVVRHEKLMESVKGGGAKVRRVVRRGLERNG